MGWLRRRARSPRAFAAALVLGIVTVQPLTAAAPAQAAAGPRDYYDVCEGGSPIDLGAFDPNGNSAAEIDVESTDATFAFGTCEAWDPSALGSVSFQLDTTNSGTPDREVVIQPGSGGTLQWSVRAPVGGPVIASGAATRPDGTSAEAVVPATTVGAGAPFRFHIVALAASGASDRLPEPNEPDVGYPYAFDCSGTTIGVEPGQETRARSSLHDAGIDAATTVVPGRSLKVAADPSRLHRLASQGRLPGVRSVEADPVRHLLAAPNDPSYPLQWALPIVHAAEARSLATPTSAVLVAVLDSGVDGNHADLAGHTVPGYDAVFDRATPSNSDRLGHGTMVASIIGAGWNDGIGMAGLAGGVSILPVRLTDATGLICSSALARGIVKAADLGARVINLSLGGSTPAQQEIDAVDYARSQGALIVAAAGNDGPGASPSYPGAYQGVVAVGATTRSDTVADYSSVGSWVTMSAPGGSGTGSIDQDVLAAFPTHYHVAVAGTSFATPMVSAAAALDRSLDSQLSPDAAAALLTLTATDLGPAGRDDGFGAGRLDAQRALQALGRTTRTAGTDRLATAIALSQLAFPAGAPAVVVAGDAAFPDALAGGPLAATQTAPLLLVPPPPSGLPSTVAQEVSRLHARTAFVLGGNSAVSPDVDTSLRNMGLAVTRISGNDRYETAADVSRNVGSADGSAFVASGEGFADAMSAGPVAGLRRVPVLLTTGDQLSQPTADAITALHVSRVTVVGGPAVVSDQVVQQLAALGVDVQRAGGGDRYATSALLADEALAAGAGPAEVMAANGANFPDALGGAAAAAPRHEPLLLLPPDDATGAATRDWLANHATSISLVRLLGGPGALSELVRVEAGVTVLG